MRYNILNTKVVESIFIDAPYDSSKDAMDDIDNGIKHNCQHCVMGECSTQDALQQANAKRVLAGKLIGE